MKKFVIVTLLISSLFTCQTNRQKGLVVEDYISNKAATIIKVNEFSDFKNDIASNQILNVLPKESLDLISKVLQTLQPEKKVLITFNDNEATKTDFSIITALTPGLLSDSIYKLKPPTSKTVASQMFVINKDTLYYSLINNVYYASNNKSLTQNILDQSIDNPSSTLLETTDPQKVFSLSIRNPSTLQPLLFLKDSDSLNAFSDVTVLDFEQKSGSIYYNGITTSIVEDSSTVTIDLFKNTIPQENTLAQIAPDNTTSMVSITYDDFSKLRKNYYLQHKIIIDSTLSYLNYSNAIGHIQFDELSIIALQTLDPTLALESVSGNTLIETYRDIDLFQIDDTTALNTLLSPWQKVRPCRVMASFKNYLLFAGSTDALKQAINHLVNGNTLSTNDAFVDALTKMSDESSYFTYKNAQGIADLIGTASTKYSINMVQLIYENNFAHVNGLFGNYKQPKAKNSVTETYAITLNNDILSIPQVVKNHVTRGHDIVVQDVQNNLYLISSTGKILWKKLLEGPILGNIEQIDIYKNGRLQLACATPNKLYVIDRNGKDVGPFPLSFKDKVTQPLSVFDYDNNKNYRLLISQGNTLIMYDKTGKQVSGFNYKTSGNVKSQPRHYRLGNKDYIVFSTDNTLKIIDRRGQNRINLKTDLYLSNNDIYLYQNKFTTTNTKGQLVQVDGSGRVTYTSLDLPEKHFVAATSKTLVTLHDNKLKIKSNDADLDFGDYTAPRIFYLNDKIFISTTDLQTNKVYLFDSLGNSIANFPVYGNSPIELYNIDNGRGIEFITKGDSNSILVYQMN